MGPLYWVSKKKRYLMGSLGNLIFLVSFSLVVLTKPPELNSTTDNNPAINTIENDRAKAAAYFNYIAPCPTDWSSLCLGCKFLKFYTRCRRQCQNICNASVMFQVAVQAAEAESRKLAGNA